MRSKEELLKLLAEYVVEMEDEEIVDIANEYLEAGYPAQEGILDGLTVGMVEAGRLYDVAFRKNSTPLYQVRL